MPRLLVGDSPSVVPHGRLYFRRRSLKTGKPPSPRLSPMKLDVLVVDGDADTAQTLAILVSMWGHEVRVARDDKTALSLVEARCPDAILLDVAMPGMSGLELATKLRERPDPKTPVLVVVSGDADEDMRQQVLKAGVRMHLA